MNIFHNVVEAEKKAAMFAKNAVGGAVNSYKKFVAYQNSPESRARQLRNIQAESGKGY